MDLKGIHKERRPAPADQLVEIKQETGGGQAIVEGTAAKGTFGPDLTHLMSRATIAAGAAPNTPENLRAWIENPNTFKPGALMPAMQLSDEQVKELVAYLSTLH